MTAIKEELATLRARMGMLQRLQLDHTPSLTRQEFGLLLLAYAEQLGRLAKEQNIAPKGKRDDLRYL
jgi:hypothetical protein